MDAIINTNYFDGSPNIAWAWGLFALLIVIGLLFILGTLHSWSSDSEASTSGAMVVTVVTLGLVACTVWLGFNNVTMQRDAETNVKASLSKEMGLTNFVDMRGEKNAFLGTTYSGHTVLCSAFNVGRDQAKVVCSR